MSNLRGEAGLKSIASGLSNLKIRPAGTGTGSVVKEQASANSETNWIFDLVVKLKKSREHICFELPRLYHYLAEPIRLLEKLQGKDYEQVGEHLVSEFSSIMTLCDQINEKFKHLHDVDDTGDSHSGAIEMAYELFHALDKLDGFLSSLVSSETTIGNTLEPVQGQASEKSETNWIFDLIIKLKKAEKHIRKELIIAYGDKVEKFVEFISKLENLEHEIKVKYKENEKLCEVLESEFSSMMTLCDQLNEKFDHLYDAMTADEWETYEEGHSSDNSDSSSANFDGLVCFRTLEAKCMADGLFKALDKLDKSCSRLVSPWWTVRNRGKVLPTLDIGKEKLDYNKNDVPTPTVDKEKKVIKIKSHDILVEELKMALSSKIPVVMLFNAKGIMPSKEYLPIFYELPNQYRNFNGDIKFLRVDVKQAATEFEVRAYPTVLVLIPKRCGLMVVGRVSIEETVIVPAFVTVLKSCLDECLWEYCGYRGALQQG